MMSGVRNAEKSKLATGLDDLDEQLVAWLLSSAKVSGLKLTGEDGVLQQLSKRLLESALEGKIADRLCYDKYCWGIGPWSTPWSEGLAQRFPHSTLPTWPVATQRASQTSLPHISSRRTVGRGCRAVRILDLFRRFMRKDVHHARPTSRWHPSTTHRKRSSERRSEVASRA